MRYTFLFFFGLILLSSSLGQSSDIRIPKYNNESMDYTLKYGVFNIGTSHIEFSKSDVCNGDFINAEARSSGFVKFIKDIHYKFESCMDTSTGLPIIASRKIVEGEFESLNKVYYNHTVRNDSTQIYSKQTDTLIVQKNIFDILTGFYHFRANYLLESGFEGWADTVTTFFIDEVWDLVIRYAGIEKIDTEFGEIECVKFMPVTSVGPFFKTTDDMCVWFTNDRRLIPIKISVEMTVGSLKAEISGYKKSTVSYY